MKPTLKTTPYRPPLSAFRLAACLLVLVAVSARFAQASLPDIILDSENAGNVAPHSIVVSGSWTDNTTAAGRHGTWHKHDGNNHGATKFVSYLPQLPGDGWYRVYLWSSANSLFANNTEVTISTKTGLVSRTVNQRQNGGTWSLVGTFEFSDLQHYSESISPSTGQSLTRAPKPTGFYQGRINTQVYPTYWIYINGQKKGVQSQAPSPSALFPNTDKAQ